MPYESPIKMPKKVTNNHLAESCGTSRNRRGFELVARDCAPREEGREIEMC